MEKGLEHSENCRVKTRHIFIAIKIEWVCPVELRSFCRNLWTKDNVNVSPYPHPIIASHWQKHLWNNQLKNNRSFISILHTFHSLSAVLSTVTNLSCFVYNENPRMPLSCAPVSTMYRGVVSSSSFSNLSFVPKESPSEHFSVLITQSSGAIWATAWVSCASKAKPPSIKVISPWDVKSGFPGISWECGWRAWNIILLSESLSTGGGWSPGIRLSFTDNIDQEWTGLITGAEREAWCTTLSRYIRDVSDWFNVIILLHHWRWCDDYQGYTFFKM